MTLLDILPSLGKAAPRRFDSAIWPVTAHSDEDGRLCVGDVPLTGIADEFGTPAYVIDETDFRPRPSLPQGAARCRGRLRRQVAADHRSGALGPRRGARHRRLLSR
jgi:hypothetical protein